MFEVEYTAGCPPCSAIADGFNGFAVQLANHEVTLCAVSRTPLEKLQAFKRRMGWTFPWASSFGGEFNSDYSVGFTAEQRREGGVEYNSRREAPWQPTAKTRDSPVAVAAAMAGTGVASCIRERPGKSAFVREDGAVYHTYSTHARGLDGLWGCTSGSAAPPRRNETGIRFRHHDAYDPQVVERRLRDRWTADITTQAIRAGSPGRLPGTFGAVTPLRKG